MVQASGHRDARVPEIPGLLRLRSTQEGLPLGFQFREGSLLDPACQRGASTTAMCYDVAALVSDRRWWRM